MLSGVPQGSILGPILFLIFINDLPDNIRSSVRLFADDCVLYRNIYSIQDCLTLQEDLTSLGQWEADWQMKFNVAKCHIMRVTRHQHHKHILFDNSLHNQTLENVQSAKYLGITISDNMDWGHRAVGIGGGGTGGRAPPPIICTNMPPPPPKKKKKKKKKKKQKRITKITKKKKKTIKLNLPEKSNILSRSQARKRVRDFIVQILYCSLQRSVILKKNYVCPPPPPICNCFLRAWVSTFQKFLPKQLRHLVSFAGTCLLHLRVQRKLHTKRWFDRN